MLTESPKKGRPSGMLLGLADKKMKFGSQEGLQGWE
jgi:hypothetical protein